MKNTIKLAALGAVALAASSSAVLAGSQLTPGISTGIALGAPLPEGVYDITIGVVQQGNTSSNTPYTLQVATPPENTPVNGLEAVIPVWLIWSTPWQIAGGRIQIDGTIPWASVDTGAILHPQLGALAGSQGWLNGLVESSIKWNLGNGWNFAIGGGAWLASDSSLLGIQETRFMGQADVAYIAGGWEVLGNFFIGSGASNNLEGLGAFLYNPAWFNYDLTVARKFGKLTVGVIAYGSQDLENGNMLCPVTSTATLNFLPACQQSQFAVGGMVGYDFGSFSAIFQVSQDVAEQNYGVKNTTGWLKIVKPLWSPEEGPLK
ncbi:MAG: transporter [Rhodomicrobium sp.]